MIRSAHAILTFGRKDTADGFISSKPCVGDIIVNKKRKREDIPINVSLYVKSTKYRVNLCYQNLVQVPSANTDSLICIFQYLTYVELIFVSRTCKQWYSVQRCIQYQDVQVSPLKQQGSVLFQRIQGPQVVYKVNGRPFYQDFEENKSYCSRRFSLLCFRRRCQSNRRSLP